MLTVKLTVKLTIKLTVKLTAKLTIKRTGKLRVKLIIKLNAKSRFGRSFPTHVCRIDPRKLAEAKKEMTQRPRGRVFATPYTAQIRPSPDRIEIHFEPPQITQLVAFD